MFGCVFSLTLRVVSVKSLRISLIVLIIKTNYTSTINIAFSFFPFLNSAEGQSHSCVSSITEQTFSSP